MTKPVELHLTLDLDRHINHGYRQVGEEDYVPEPATVETLVIEEAARQLLAGADRDVKGDLRARVRAVTDGEIAERVRPLVEEAIQGPVRETNNYGEPTGPETTLRALIVKTAEETLRRRDNNSRYLNRPVSLLEAIVEEEVKRALARELKAAVDQAKAELAAAVRDQAATVLTEAIQRAIR